MDSTVDLMISILRDKFQVKLPLTPNSDVNEIGLDSLDVINFLFSVEEKTGVAIPDAAIAAENLRTLSSFASYVSKRLVKAQGARAGAAA